MTIYYLVDHILSATRNLSFGSSHVLKQWVFSVN